MPTVSTNQTPTELAAGVEEGYEYRIYSISVPQNRVVVSASTVYSCTSVVVVSDVIDGSSAATAAALVLVSEGSEEDIVVVGVVVDSVVGDVVGVVSGRVVPVNSFICSKVML